MQDDLNGPETNGSNNSDHGIHHNTSDRIILISDKPSEITRYEARLDVRLQTRLEHREWVNLRNVEDYDKDGVVTDLGR